jgi:hypothetical protein
MTDQENLVLQRAGASRNRWQRPPRLVWASAGLPVKWPSTGKSRRAGAHATKNGMYLQRQSGHVLCQTLLYQFQFEDADIGVYEHGGSSLADSLNGDA